jgi:hypothetical protein
MLAPRDAPGGDSAAAQTVSYPDSAASPWWSPEASTSQSPDFGGNAQPPSWPDALINGRRRFGRNRRGEVT